MPVGLADADPVPDSEPRRDALRRLLRDLLRTDSDLDAFCLDHFLDVHRRYAAGMDVVSKVNLLLALIEPTKVLLALRQQFHDNPSILLTIDQRVQRPESPEARQARLRRATLRHLYIEREQLRARGLSTAVLDLQIVEVKRTVRRGPQLQEGDVLSDRYELLERIGHGGFSIVWQAFDTQRRCLVAIKVLHGDLGEGDHRVERFRRGARQMQKLQHPHIVRILDGPSECSGFHYFVMDYLPGGDLERAVVNKTIDTATAMMAVLDVGRALECTHAQRMIHRDVKPKNILLDAQHQSYLTDFDLVWAPDTTGGTRTGALGTFLYGAPEAMEDASSVDARADVYSLAMSTIFVLYGGKLPRRVLDQRISFINHLPWHEELRALLTRSTETDPVDRPITITAYCAELSEIWSRTKAVPEVTVKDFSEATGSITDTATLEAVLGGVPEERPPEPATKAETFSSMPSLQSARSEEGQVHAVKPSLARGRSTLLENDSGGLVAHAHDGIAHAERGKEVHQLAVRQITVRSRLEEIFVKSIFKLSDLLVDVKARSNGFKKLTIYNRIILLSAASVVIIFLGALAGFHVRERQNIVEKARQDRLAEEENQRQFAEEEKQRQFAEEKQRQFAEEEKQRRFAEEEKLRQFAEVQADLQRKRREAELIRDTLQKNNLEKSNKENEIKTLQSTLNAKQARIRQINIFLLAIQDGTDPELVRLRETRHQRLKAWEREKSVTKKRCEEFGVTYQKPVISSLSTRERQTLTSQISYEKAAKADSDDAAEKLKRYMSDEPQRLEIEKQGLNSEVNQISQKSLPTLNSQLTQIQAAISQNQARLIQINKEIGRIGK